MRLLACPGGTTPFWPDPQFFLDFLKSRGEGNNFSVFLVCVQPGLICHHVAMHINQLEGDLGWIGYFFHDLLALELVDKG